jgi:ABC-type Mn2+/Zn2+ transport system permease subunit
VTREDVWTAGGLAVLVLGCVGIFYKDLMFVTFDPEMAEVTGLPAGKLYFLLISLIALTVVVSIKVVGIVLVSALLVIPAAAAFQLTERFRNMMALAVVFGVGSTILGLFISYWLEIASGAAIVLLATLVFFVCAALSPRRRRKGDSQSA